MELAFTMSRCYNNCYNKKDAMGFVTGRELFKGVSSGQFAPNRPMKASIINGTGADFNPNGSIRVNISRLCYTATRITLA